jgi:PIN domain nuclease of toxin-antitoxin system
VRLLLDTHAFLWAAGDPARLSKRAREAIADPANEVFVSAAVSWEIVIKAARGKITLPMSAATYIHNRLQAFNFTPLPITHEHALALAGLPPIHADPFDRMMIAQAQVEGAAFVTSDAIARRYPCNRLW